MNEDDSEYDLANENILGSSNDGTVYSTMRLRQLEDYYMSWNM